MRINLRIALLRRFGPRSHSFTARQLKISEGVLARIVRGDRHVEPRLEKRLRGLLGRFGTADNLLDVDAVATQETTLAAQVSASP